MLIPLKTFCEWRDYNKLVGGWIFAKDNAMKELSNRFKMIEQLSGRLCEDYRNYSIAALPRSSLTTLRSRTPHHHHRYHLRDPARALRGDVPPHVATT